MGKVNGEEDGLNVNVTDEKSDIDNGADWKALLEGVRRPLKGRRVNETARAYVEYREYPAKANETKARFEIRCMLCQGRSKGGRRVLKNNSIEDAFNVTTWTAHFVETCDFIAPEIRAALTGVSRSKRLKKADGTAVLTTGSGTDAAENAFVRVSAHNAQEAEEERVVTKFRELCEKNAPIAETEGYRKDQLRKNSTIIFLANLLKMRIPAIKAVVDEVDELDRSGLIDEQQCVYIVHQLMSSAQTAINDATAEVGEAEMAMAEPASEVAEPAGDIPDGSAEPHLT